MKKFFGAVFAAGLFVSACGDSTAGNDEDKSDAEQEESLVDEDSDGNADKEEMPSRESTDEPSEEDPGQEGSSDGDEQAVADAIAEDLAVRFNVDDDSVVQQEDARCIGEKYVEEFGLEDLEGLGITSDGFPESLDFSDEDLQKVNAAVETCIGSEKAFAAGLQQGSTIDLETADAECIASKVDSDLLKRLSESDPDPEGFEELEKQTKDAAEDCGVAV